MHNIVLTQIDKCRGAMLATAIGDALGWPNEPRSKNKNRDRLVVDGFVEWVRTSKKPRWHDEIILPGEYSDDTQLTLAVARSIIVGKWEKFFAEKELPFWLKYERGGGGTLLRAAKIWESGMSPWSCINSKDYFDAGGNGAVMRILPHVIANAKSFDIKGLMVDVIKDSRITHGHPRAILGATCYAYALDYLLKKETVLEYGELISEIVNGVDIWGAYPNSEIFEGWLNCANQNIVYNFFEEWTNVRISMMKKLVFISDALRKGLLVNDTAVLTELGCFSKEKGAGDVTILAALYFASKYANNPSLGIKVPAYSFGIDTDTIASITGGLLGMLNGTQWIPSCWFKVQDSDCLIRIAELLMSDNKKKITKEEIEKVNSNNDSWIDYPIGRMKLIKSSSFLNGVVIEKYQTALGQTLYLKLLYFKKQINNDNDDRLLKKAFDDTKSNPQKKFILNSNEVSNILNNSDLKSNISIGKFFKIMNELMCNQKTIFDIAKKYKVDESFVRLVNEYIS